jgi:aminoglycoside phosphotransferase (APT) family kinase protein
MRDPPVARCYQAAYCQETGASHLLFDDISESHFAPRSSIPPPLRQAEKAMDALAQFHAFWWDHPALCDVDSLPTLESVAAHVADTYEHFGPFADALGDRLTNSRRRIYEGTLASLPKLWERVLQSKDLTLIHGDANFSNVLLPRDPDKDRALFIDWQLWGVSFAAEDLSHLIALFWDREHRQRMEKDLLMRYHRALMEHDVKGYEWPNCWEDYRLAVLLRVLFMPMWFRASGASDALWERSLERALQAVEDLGCLELLKR